MFLSVGLIQSLISVRKHMPLNNLFLRLASLYFSNGVSHDKTWRLFQIFILYYNIQSQEYGDDIFTFILVPLPSS